MGVDRLRRRTGPGPRPPDRHEPQRKATGIAGMQLVAYSTIALKGVPIQWSRLYVRFANQGGVQ